MTKETILRIARESRHLPPYVKTQKYEALKRHVYSISEHPDADIRDLCRELDY